MSAATSEYQGINRSVLDSAEDAHNRLTAIGAVLSRLFEYVAAVADSNQDGQGLVIDFGKEREYEYWEGLRLLTKGMVADAERVKAALDAATHRSDGAR